MANGDYTRKAYEDVFNEFKEAGCVLLSETYKNNSTKLRYVCICGSESEIRYADFRSGSRCSGCKARKSADRARKYSIEKVREIFAEKGCTLIATEYKNTKELLEYICSCGTRHKIRLNNFLYQNNRCPECKRHALSGPNNYLWKPELTDVERKRNKSRLNIPELSRWRRRVFKRDNHTCQYCERRGGITLNAHHLDAWHWCEEKRYDDDNGATLCAECHEEFHAKYSKYNNTRSQYEEWLATKRKQGA